MGYSYAEVLRALQCARPNCRCQNTRGNVLVHCPNTGGHANGDANPSCHLSRKDNGEALLACQSRRCSWDDMLAGLRARMGDRGSDGPTIGSPRPAARGDGEPPHPAGSASPSSPPKARRVRPRPVATYTYRDATSGEPVALKERIENPDGTKEFTWGMLADPTRGLEGKVRLKDLGLYAGEDASAADALLARPHDPVWFVEGEKAREAADKAGLLALCHGGGASTRDFGDALDVLQGREVYLWPDNDDPGRAYMEAVQATARYVAADVHVITAPVPYKGDAYDYFVDQGGSVDDLLEQNVTRMFAEILADDQIRIHAPSRDFERIAFTFSELDYGRHHAVYGEIDVHVEQQGDRSKPFVRRLNLMSSSDVSQKATELGRLYDNGGKTSEWPALLTEATSIALQHFRERQSALNVWEIEDPGPLNFLVDGFLPLGEPSMIFCHGEVGKTWLAQVIATCVANGEPFLDREVAQRPVMFLDWEDDAANFRRRFRRIADGMELLPNDMLRYRNCRGRPLADQIAEIRREVQSFGIGFLIIDSAAMAVGGDAIDPISVAGFFSALQRIGVTSLTLAHQSAEDVKQQSDSKPFGGIFWYNEMRAIYYLQRSNVADDPDRIRYALFARKASQFRRPEEFGYELVFEGHDGPVTIEMLDAYDLAGDKVLASRREAQEQIRDYLFVHGQATVKAIAEGLPEMGIETVRRTLNRSNYFIQTDVAGRAVVWGLSGRDGLPFDVQEEPPPPEEEYDDNDDLPSEAVG